MMRQVTFSSVRWAEKRGKKKETAEKIVTAPRFRAAVFLLAYLSSYEQRERNTSCKISEKEYQQLDICRSRKSDRSLFQAFG